MAEWLSGFPSPVHQHRRLVYVHRNIAVPHEPAENCACQPLALTTDEMDDPRRDIAAELNARERLN